MKLSYHTAWYWLTMGLALYAMLLLLGGAARPRYVARQDILPGTPQRGALQATDGTTPVGSPLGAYPLTITQGYGVGTHAPAATWGGVDLAAPEGTPLYATVSGTARTSVTWPCGNGVEITNGRYRTLYCHMRGFAVADGATVAAGDPVGAVGQSGQATGPHVHYETWQNGANTDPMTFLEDR